MKDVAPNYSQLNQIALQVRRDVLTSIKAAGSGHLASSLGSAEIFTYFYNQVLRVRPRESLWSERDLFLLSAGHLCPAWYATLANRGYFDRTLLAGLRQLGSKLQGHPHYQPELGIENSAGSLGQGVSLAAGITYGLRQQNCDRQVFVLSSDGEQQEGQCYEAYLFAAHYHLSNYAVIVDCNQIQQSGAVKDVINLADLKQKFLALNFAVGVGDGNDFSSLHQAWQQLQVAPHPKALLCYTTPGKGVSFMENDYHWHAQFPTPIQWQQAYQELGMEVTS